MVRERAPSSLIVMGTTVVSTTASHKQSRWSLHTLHVTIPSPPSVLISLHFPKNTGRQIHLLLHNIQFGREESELY